MLILNSLTHRLFTAFQVLCKCFTFLTLELFFAKPLYALSSLQMLAFYGYVNLKEVQFHSSCTKCISNPCCNLNFCQINDRYFVIIIEIGSNFFDKFSNKNSKSLIKWRQMQDSIYEILFFRAYLRKTLRCWQMPVWLTIKCVVNWTI